MMRQVTLLCSAYLLMAMTCGSTFVVGDNPGFYEKGYEVPYFYNAPTHTFALAGELVEISGLAYSTEHDLLLAVNDEEAFIYKLSLQDGHIIDKVDFGKPDDYEGLTYHEGIIYVTESNGNVKVIDELRSEKIAEYNEWLTRANNIEGCTYHQRSGKVLLAAKGHNRRDGNDMQTKSLFAMDLSSGAIAEEPFLEIHILSAVKDLIEREATAVIPKGASISDRLSAFAPSGVAVHPVTGDIFILSAKGRLLVVVDDHSQQVKGVTFLNEMVHTQPEGICFSPDGTLYIANEGRRSTAQLHTYTPVLADR